MKLIRITIKTIKKVNPYKKQNKKKVLQYLKFYLYINSIILFILF